MAIKITIKNVKSDGNSRILNNAKIKEKTEEDLDIHVENLEGDLVLLENLEIEPFMNDLEKKFAYMNRNSLEYNMIEQILSERTTISRKKLIKKIAACASSFSQGVLASILANYITK